MSTLTAHDKRKCRELGERILNVAQGVAPAACLIFCTSIEQLAQKADEQERMTFALMMIQSALRIDPTALDTRH